MTITCINNMCKYPLISMFVSLISLRLKGSPLQSSSAKSGSFTNRTVSPNLGHNTELMGSVGDLWNPRRIQIHGGNKRVWWDASLSTNWFVMVGDSNCTEQYAKDSQSQFRSSSQCLQAEHRQRSLKPPASLTIITKHGFWLSKKRLPLQSSMLHSKQRQSSRATLHYLILFSPQSWYFAHDMT